MSSSPRGWQTVEVELRDRRPLAERFERLLQLGIVEHIHSFEGNAVVVQHLNNCV
jgi:hypothetical protein